MESFFGKRWSRAAVAIAIAASVLLAYSNAFHVPFQFDDQAQIVKNRLIRDLGNLPAIIRSVRPVTTLTLALNYAAHGLSVLGYHIVNLSIHILNAVLAYFLVLKTMRLARFEEARGNLIATFSALIFALHPVQTQAVTYIVQRSESLSALFYLASLLLFIKGTEKQGAARLSLYVLTGASFALGFYSKEIAFTIPLAVLLYDFYFTSGGNLRRVAGRWPLYLILGVLFAFFTVTGVVPLGGFNDLSAESSVAELEEAAPGPGPARPPSAGLGMKRIISPKEYFLTELNVLVYYISLLFVPANQNIDYDFPVSRSLFGTPRVNEGAVLNIPIPPPFVSLIILVLIAGGAVYLSSLFFKRGFKEGGVIGFSVLWFFILLAPTSSFIPILDVIFEHRLYLSTLAFSIVLATSVDLLARKALCGEAPPGGPKNY